MKNSTPSRRALAPPALALITTLGLGLPAMAEEIFELDPFLVPSTADQPYSPQFSNSATLVSIQRDRIPFVTNVITSALAKDAGIDNLADVASLVSGMSVETNPAIADEQGQPALSFRVRGFQSRPLYNGFQIGGRVANADNIERVEVSKGPNSVMYGQSSGGGIINLIPRMPQFDQSNASVEAAFGNRDYLRGAFDISGPVDSENLGKLAFRMGGAWTEFGREQIFFENRTSSVNSGISWAPLASIKLDVVAEYNKMEIIPSRTAAFVSVGSGPNRVVDAYNRQRNDRNFTYTGPHTKNDFETAIVSGYLTSKLTESLNLRLGAIWTRQTEDSMRFVGAYGLGTSATASSPYEKRDVTDTLKGYKIDLLHRGAIRGFSIDSLLGYESYLQKDRLSAIRTGNPDGTQRSLPVTIPFDRKTVVADWPTPPPLNEFTHRRNDDRKRTETSNLRFTQIVTNPDERATLMWGLAYGEGESRLTNRVAGQTAELEGDDTTYNVGLSYRIIDRDDRSVTLFANTSSSFLIQEGNQQNPADFQGFTSVEALRDFVNNLTPNPIAPEEGQGFEIGSRASLLGGNLNATVAYFDQTRTNIRRSFFVRESNVAGVTSENVLATFFLASGEERIRGFDFEVSWNPMPNLTVIGGASIADAEVVSNINEPGEEGLSLPQTPETTLHAWVKYDFTDGAVAGLSMGIGASYSDSTRVLPAFNDRFRVSDSYTDVYAMLRYTFAVGKLEHVATVNVRNLFDSEWVNESNWLSEGRQFRFSYLVRW